MTRIRRYSLLSILTALTAILFWFAAATPSQAHWADLAAAEIWIDEASAQMTLTFPTGLVPFADDDRSGQLSEAEIRTHAAALQNFLDPQIRMVDSKNQNGMLTVQPIAGELPATLRVAPNTHTTLLLNYTWTTPARVAKIHYNLFVPGVATASCLATIEQSGHLKTFVFTPKQLDLTLGSKSYGVGELLVAIVGAFAWGAVHSMSPGHGKTIVGAYLVGERATPKHALLLAMTTTITHTIGVFALGLVTLFAAKFILPEQLYPWLSLISGILVAAIGFNLLKSRLRSGKSKQFLTGVNRTHHSHAPHHSHDHGELHASPSPDHAHDTHTHSDSHSHEISHSHSHDRPEPYHHDPAHNQTHRHGHDHSHSHLPPGADGSPLTWRSLVAMGVSGGLVPCPAALVLLLSTIAVGNVGLGLVLVLAFSLGLAGVLTGLGLMLVYTKRLFQQIPSRRLRLVKMLPAVSALGILLLGCGISAKALFDLGWVGT